MCVLFSVCPPIKSTYLALEKGKLKKHKASVSGVLVDGVGYGTATIKKLGSWTIAIR